MTLRKNWLAILCPVEWIEVFVELYCPGVAHE